MHRLRFGQLPEPTVRCVRFVLILLLLPQLAKPPHVVFLPLLLSCLRDLDTSSVEGAKHSGQYFDLLSVLLRTSKENEYAFGSPFGL